MFFSGTVLAALALSSAPVLAAPKEAAMSLANRVQKWSDSIRIICPTRETSLTCSEQSCTACCGQCCQCIVYPYNKGGHSQTIIEFEPDCSGHCYDHLKHHQHQHKHQEHRHKHHEHEHKHKHHEHEHQHKHHGHHGDRCQPGWESCPYPNHRYGHHHGQHGHDGHRHEGHRSGHWEYVFDKDQHRQGRQQGQSQQQDSRRGGRQQQGGYGDDREEYPQANRGYKE